ncbi:hypothetical protein MMC18_007144 [Xylographa bjoerkii]|nr:hypothetical protein [Xylographa bjoerkii]
MDNITPNVDSRSDIPMVTLPAVTESPPPAANQPASTNVDIAPEVIKFLSEFFLAMQIPAPDSTEAHIRIFHRNQEVMLNWLRDANEVRLRLERQKEVCMQMARAIEQGAQELVARETLAARVDDERRLQAYILIRTADSVLARVTAERLGGPIRRAGRAVRSFFRRPRREVEEDRGDEVRDRPLYVILDEVRDRRFRKASAVLILPIRKGPLRNTSLCLRVFSLWNINVASTDMSFLAPFSSYMKLGQGFNSYTQEVCIEDAVLIEPNQTATRSSSIFRPEVPVPPLRVCSETAAPSSVPEKVAPPCKNLSQIVTYSSRSVCNMADIIDALNLSASASIKYGTVKGSGSASFVNENKVSQSDVSYIITVKVTNETSTIADHMVFNPLENMDPKHFTDFFGDCFISGFLEGGEFSAIISIKVNDKSKIREVKAAAEVDLAIAAAPGLTAGASTSVDKKKTSVWNDTETTISVNWSGGGEIKDPATKWDLATVVNVASRFPHLVETSAQRTSAILTKYTSLRSFVVFNTALVAKTGPLGGYSIKNYELCQLYTMDLFSAYMAYKSMWTQLSDMMKHTHRFQEREKSKDVPDPIALTAESLNKARLFARKEMTLIADENARLIREPELSDVDETGEQRPLPYTYPGKLAMRLPVKIPHSSTSDQSDASSSSRKPTKEETAAISAYARRDGLHFSPLAGDHPSLTHALLDRGKSKAFCTLEPSVVVLTKLRFHAHEHHYGDLFADCRRHSKSSQGCLSAIGFSTSGDANARPLEDGTHHRVGHPNDNLTYWSRLADLSFAKVAKVVVEYVPGSGRVAALSLWDGSGNEVTSWRQYGQAKLEKPRGLRVVEQMPPEGRGGWLLVGFWGSVDAVVVARVGAVWKRDGGGHGGGQSANGSESNVSGSGVSSTR